MNPPHNHVEQMLYDTTTGADHTLIAHLPVGIYRTRPDGTVLFANHALVTMLGYDSLEDLQAASAINFYLNPLDRIQQLEQLKSQSGVVQQEVTLRRKDGTAIWARDMGQIIYDDTGEIAWVDGILEDITERRRAELALRESEEKYRQLFANKLEAISIFDGETGQLLDVNHAWETLYGYTREEVISSNLHVTDVSGEPDKTMAAVRESRLSAKGMRIPVRWHKDRYGRVFPVEIYTGTFEWKGRRVMCAAMRDISERHEAEKQRLELALEKERVDILSQFINQASHEFRTPLAIIGASSYLLDKLDDPAQIEEHQQAIQEQVESVARLVDSMLLMSKFGRDSAGLTLHPLDLNQIIHMICAGLQAEAAKKQITITCTLTTQTLIVSGDGDYLGRAINSILSNAIQHTAPGGKITLSSAVRGDTAVAEITDDGSGIDDGDLPRIFEQFYRGQNAGIRRGFGLGLPIAKRIIEAHAGCIECESAPGKGSTFRVCLPRIVDQS